MPLTLQLRLNEQSVRVHRFFCVSLGRFSDQRRRFLDFVDYVSGGLGQTTTPDRFARRILLQLTNETLCFELAWRLLNLFQHIFGQRVQMLRLKSELRLEGLHDSRVL